ncbi:MAG: AmmeMemoRadiSam system protein B [Anaerolineae bacterium]|nr:AmmeMemoRadiSam system protein B [Anaerolineae bacterium]
MSVAQPSEIRPAQFADDQWYPSSAARLRRQIESLLAEAPFMDLGRPLGLVVPHAGIRFSGGVAAQAYRQIEGQIYDPVVILSPLHRRPLGPYAVTSYRYYSSPLGLVPVDEDLVTALGSVLPVTRVSVDEEHSLEIQLPFLQHTLGQFDLLPIMMGDQSPSSGQALASALAPLLRERQPLVVASSDLSHFHDYDTAVELDRGLIERLEAYDPDGLARMLERGEAEACGGGPIYTAMLLCRALGATRVRVLQYANSGDVWMDRSRVVGYVSAVLLPPE